MVLFWTSCDTLSSFGENMSGLLFSEKMTAGGKLAINFSTYLLGTREVASPL